MSLINKMLRDLESRQDLPEARQPEVIYEDLQASRPAGNPERRRPPAVALALLGVAVIAGAVAAWFMTDGSRPPAPSPVAVATPPPAITEPSVASAIPAEKAEPAPIEKPRVVPPKPVVRKMPPKAVPPAVPARRPKPAITVPKPVAARTPVAKPGQVEKVVRPLSSAEQAEAAHREAAVLLQQGRGGEAEEKLRTAIAHHPGHAAARELLVGLLLQRGARDQARQQLEAGIAASPGHLAFYRLLARLHVDAGQEARALALLESANPRAVNDIEHQRFLAALYQRAGRHVEAVKTYRQAVTLRPYDGRAWLGLGISLEALEHWKDAATAYQRALAGNGLDERLADYVRQRLAIAKNKQ